MAETMGELVKRLRTAAGLSLAKVAGPMGVSAPFLHDVEHDRRRVSPARWASLVDVLPGLTLRALAETAVASGPVEVDARYLTPEQRARIVDALELAARAA